MRFELVGAALALISAPAWGAEASAELPKGIERRIAAEFPRSTILACEKRDTGLIAYKVVINDEEGIRRTVLIVRKQVDERQAKR